MHSCAVFGICRTLDKRCSFHGVPSTGASPLKFHTKTRKHLRFFYFSSSLKRAQSAVRNKVVSSKPRKFINAGDVCPDSAWPVESGKTVAGLGPGHAGVDPGSGSWLPLHGTRPYLLQ